MLNPAMGFSPSTLLPPVNPAHERTVLLMFSKGYKVNESELRNFITRSFGDCIESLNMQEATQSADQPLFAHIVFYSPETIDTVLNGATKGKINVNGKHVYAQKFVSAPRTKLSS